METNSKSSCSIKGRGAHSVEARGDGGGSLDREASEREELVGEAWGTVAHHWIELLLKGKSLL